MDDITKTNPMPKEVEDMLVRNWLEWLDWTPPKHLCKPTEVTRDDYAYLNTYLRNWGELPPLEAWETEDETKY